MVHAANISKRNSMDPPRGLPPIVAENYSESISGRILNEARKCPGINARRWIHLDDAVQRGTVSKLEAIDALFLGYVPEYLACRPSLYVNTF